MTELQRDRFKNSLAARNFEIELLWKRGAFFWTFIAVAFAGFGLVAKDGHHALAILIGNFGFFASVCWAWANRGSKFWFEVWEKRTEREETEVVGSLFGDEYPDLGRGRRHRLRFVNPKYWLEVPGRWLGPHRYSVSGIAIAVSDYIAFL